MELKRNNWILRPRAAADEVRVVGEDPHPGHPLQHPLPECARNTDFRFEGPTVGAKVDQLRGIVLSQRWHHDEADANDRLLAVRREHFGCHRRRPIQVHRQPESRIPWTEAVYLRGLAEIPALHVADNHGYRDPRVGRASGEVERPREENAVVLMVALASSMGADGSNATSPKLKLLTTVAIFNPLGIGQ